MRHWCSPKRKPGASDAPGFLCAVAGLLTIQPLANELVKHTGYDGEDKRDNEMHEATSLPRRFPAPRIISQPGEAVNIKRPASRQGSHNSILDSQPPAVLSFWCKGYMMWCKFHQSESPGVGHTPGLCKQERARYLTVTPKMNEKNNPLP